MAPTVRQNDDVRDDKTAVMKNSWISCAGTDPYPLTSPTGVDATLPSTTTGVGGKLNGWLALEFMSRAEPVEDELFGVLIAFVPEGLFFKSPMGSKFPSPTRPRG
jgi:hypothetical protein